MLPQSNSVMTRQRRRDSETATAQATWEIENNIKAIEADQIFKFDEQAQAECLAQKPWSRDPHFFKNVRISALALLKMVVHARSGGTIEVMGIMQGKVDGNTFVVLDAFALPVEGTETRVNAQAEAYEYMVEYVHASKQVSSYLHHFASQKFYPISEF